MIRFIYLYTYVSHNLRGNSPKFITKFFELWKRDFTELTVVYNYFKSINLCNRTTDFCIILSSFYQVSQVVGFLDIDI